ARMPLMMDLLDWRAAAFANHSLKPLLRGVQLGLELGRIASIDPLHDLLVIGRHLRFVLFDVADRPVNLVFPQLVPEADQVAAPPVQPGFPRGGTRRRSGRGALPLAGFPGSGSP